VNTSNLLTNLEVYNPLVCHTSSCVEVDIGCTCIYNSYKRSSGHQT